MADVTLAANNPDLGGGEQMLLRHAEALLELGHSVTVVAPDSPPEVLDAAAAVGTGVVAIRADGRRDYLRRLRSWDRPSDADCCGATVWSPLRHTGHRDRIIHLHQDCHAVAAQRAALMAASVRSTRILTPVLSM